jgi:hypothetical protein
MSLVPMKKPEACNSPAGPYEPTADEVRKLGSLERRRAKARSGPFLKSETIENVCRIEADHPHLGTAYDLMMESFGVTEYPLLAGLLGDLGGLAQRGKETHDTVMNYAISILRGINPQDPTEALLGSQMAAIHMTMMKFANRLTTTSTNDANFGKIEAIERSMNRLARTFAAQVEALKRYRSKGEQRVYVERVNVEAGAQAVVGNVGRGEG